MSANIKIGSSGDDVLRKYVLIVLTVKLASR